MAYTVGLVAERDVDQAYLESAATSALRLAESVGSVGDPDISLQYIDGWRLPTNRQGQVDRTVLDSMGNAFDLQMLVTARDLGVGDTERSRLNFVFGMSRLGRIVMSTYRLQTPEDFEALILHEGGHGEGLVQPDMKNLDRVSVFGGHCVNQCLMRPGASYDDMRSMVRQSRLDNPFCGDCTGFLRYGSRFARSRR